MYMYYIYNVDVNKREVNKMTKKELTKKFNLTKTNTKCNFADGMKSVVRTLYINKHGDLYVFYGNDLHVIKPSSNTPYVEGIEEINGYLGAGYSWYHC